MDVLQLIDRMRMGRLRSPLLTVITIWLQLVISDLVAPGDRILISICWLLRRANFRSRVVLTRRLQAT
jgi:hypothetical protein